MDSPRRCAPRADTGACRLQVVTTPGLSLVMSSSSPHTSVTFLCKVSRSEPTSAAPRTAGEQVVVLVTGVVSISCVFTMIQHRRLPVPLLYPVSEDIAPINRDSSPHDISVLHVC